jgi:DNA-directed RNA polymerase specialized sigma24 family protein
VDEREQVREISAACAASLVSQVYALTGDFAEAQDVVQEAFARELGRPGRLVRTDNPEAWLRTVAVNLARSRHRRRAQSGWPTNSGIWLSSNGRNWSFTDRPTITTN